MKYKVIIIGAAIVFLYFWKKKKDKEKQDKEMEVALKENELPAANQVEIIRLKLDDFLKYNWPFMSDEERMQLVINLTSDLEQYQKQYGQYKSIM